jgi:LacI family transcriptional regulator
VTARRRAHGRRPTMSDVAAVAGVSLKTVSRVVNAEEHVSPSMAERVRDAIATLGYRPDGRARDLATAPAIGRLVGFVQVDAANPFFSAVYRGLEDVVSEHGLLLLAGSTDGDPEREARLVETLVEWRVDALVVAGAEGADELLRDEIVRGTPVVCVDRMLPELSCDTVVSSNRDSTRAAVTHLLDRGHRHVAFLGGDPRVWTVQERLAGYAAALGGAGVTRDPRLEVLDVGDVERAASATRALLTSPASPTALFAAQDRISMGAIAALHELERAGNTALFGFDDVPFADVLEPPVSVVAQDPYRMGRRAGQLLIAQLTQPREPELVVLDAPLHHRASGDIRPIG